jgi:hypothetical protein
LVSHSEGRTMMRKLGNEMLKRILFSKICEMTSNGNVYNTRKV